MKTSELRTRIQETRARYDTLCDIIESLENSQKWYLLIEYDKDGNNILDDNGEYLKREPAREDWSYQQYTAYTDVIDVVKKMIKL